MTALRISIDPDVCFGGGSCTLVAPHAFEIDDDGVAHLLEPVRATDEEIEAAVANCPSGAIAFRAP
jgi:ferredoxin